LDRLSEIENKILHTYEQAASWAGSKRANGQRIIFTNGCFDLLHYGHIHYLAEAASLGDALIVAINAQESVSRLKGAHRPIQDEKSRVFQIASLFFVEKVIIFHEDTPLQLIEAVTPDILVKGGDWPVEKIVGAEWVKEHGGLVQCLAFQEGYSTTRIEEKIKRS